MKKTVNLLKLRESGALEHYTHQTTSGMYRVKVPIDTSACSRGWNEDACTLLKVRKYLLAYHEGERLFPIREQFTANEWAMLNNGSFSYEAMARRGCLIGVNSKVWSSGVIGFCRGCGKFYDDAHHKCEAHHLTCECGARLATAEEKAHGKCRACQDRLVNHVAEYHSRYTKNAGLVFFEQEANRDDTLHFGGEIEIEADVPYRLPHAKIFSDIFKNNVFAPFIEYERDASLDGGCECITAPTTLHGYERRAEQFAQFYEVAKNRCSAHFGNNNGLHFHLDRAFFGDETNQTKSAIALQVMIYKFYNFFMSISGRKNGHFCYTRMKTGCENFINSALRFQYTDHRDAVNTQNRHTIELRFFGGHIDTGEKFLACADIVNALAKWAKRSTLANIDRSTPIILARYIKNAERVKRYLQTLPSDRLHTTDGDQMITDFINALDIKGGAICA